MEISIGTIDENRVKREDVNRKERIKVTIDWERKARRREEEIANETRFESLHEFTSHLLRSL